MVERESYTSANCFPTKVLWSDAARSLSPAHVQWLPTNLCNFHCTFCSCRNRSRTQSMDLSTALDVIRGFVKYGTRAVTITGGGEPLCHPDLPAMIDAFADADVKVGLVTNGTLLGRLSAKTLSQLTWCRISNSDERTLTGEYQAVLDAATETNIDWAFSHVVSGQPNLAEISRIIDYATAHDFTHVRLVADLMAPEKVQWDSIHELLAGRDSRVVYQERKHHVPSERCWIGYVKPVITPDFKMYLCCGVQYALDDEMGGFPDSLCMGSALDLPAIYDHPRRYFRVSCNRCYYQDYNTVLEHLSKPLEHMEFV